MRFFILKPINTPASAEMEMSLLSFSEISLPESPPDEIATFSASLGYASSDEQLVKLRTSDQSLSISPTSFKLGGANPLNQIVTVRRTTTGPSSSIILVDIAGLPNQSLRVNRPQDPLKLSVAPSQINIGRESEVNVSTFTVALNRAPLYPVTVNLISQEPTVIVSPATFSLGGEKPISQNVTLTSFTKGPEYVTVQVNSSEFQPQFVSVDRTQGPLELTVTPDTVSLGRTAPENVATISVELNHVSDSTVPVSVTSSDTSVSVFPSTFGLGNGNPLSQSVTLNGTLSGPNAITITVNAVKLPAKTASVTRPAFLPSMIPGLAQWLDASDAASITVDGAINVSEWRDKSGFGRHYLQANAGLRPRLTTATLNGLNAIEFTNDWLSSDFSFTAGSVFILWEHPTVATDAYSGIMTVRSSSGSSMNLICGLPGTNPTSSVYLENTASNFVGRLNGIVRPNANWNNWTNGVPVNTLTHRWNIISASFTPNAGRKYIFIGADIQSAGNRRMQNGKIAEILVYDRQIGTGDVAVIEDYLRTKWNISM